MKFKIAALTSLLAACSSTSLQDVQTKDAPTIDNRAKQNLNNGTSNINVIVSAIAEPVVEVRKDKITDRANPNSLFRDSSVYFDLDEYTVKESFILLLKQHAEFLIKNPNEFVFIEGHTDERGSTEYNLALGQRRANAVKMTLLALGVQDNQMEAFSYGSTKPRAIGGSEEAWAKNRRVDLDYRN